MIHVGLKLLREVMMEAPIKAEKHLSGEAVILMGVPLEASSSSSFISLSSSPGKRVLPPDSKISAEILLDVHVTLHSAADHHF